MARYLRSNVVGYGRLRIGTCFLIKTTDELLHLYFVYGFLFVVFCVCVVQPSAVEDAERDITTTVMGIYTIRRDGREEPEDVGVVIEGIKVLNNLGGVIMGFIMLFGLVYALDLAFPENLKYSFEFFQKIIMNLDGHKLNAKIQQPKIKLFS